jgi:hypothetical protein
VPTAPAPVRAHAPTPRPPRRSERRCVISTPATVPDDRAEEADRSHHQRHPQRRAHNPVLLKQRPAQGSPHLAGEGIADRAV